MAQQVRPLPKPPTVAQSKGRQRYNFGLASGRDIIVFGSERPGQPKPNPDAPTTPRGPLVPTLIVDQWASHMKSKGIKRTLCLLGESELGFYEDPLLDTLKKHFGQSELSVVHVAPHEQGSLGKISRALDEAIEHSEPIVVFCSTGQLLAKARTGMVLAYWLHSHYHATISESVTEVIEFAAANGAIRKPTVEQVLQFVIGAAAKHMPSLQTMGAGDLPFATPRADTRLHITFVQTGGTIDKDYPRMMGGYAFEITDPAVNRILRDVPAGFTHDVITVCRKDSQEITVEDRQALVETLRRADSFNFIVTHGTDTMIETAKYVAAAKGLVQKRVVFTGAMRPQKMSDSDASFNIGAAVGALNVIGNGVYVVMNGRLFEANSVRRDGRSGHFTAL